MTLTELEAALSAAKAAGDAAKARSLLPAVNAARRAAKAADAAWIKQLADQGLHPDGTPFSPDDRLYRAIFG
jgi:hypothetical protein